MTGSTFDNSIRIRQIRIAFPVTFGVQAMGLVSPFVIDPPWSQVATTISRVETTHCDGGA